MSKKVSSPNKSTVRAESAISPSEVAVLKSAFLNDDSMTFRRLAEDARFLIGREVNKRTIEKCSETDPDGAWSVLREHTKRIVCKNCGAIVDVDENEIGVREQMAEMAGLLYKDIKGILEKGGTTEAAKIRMWLELVDRSGHGNTRKSDGFTIDDIIEAAS